MVNAEKHKKDFEAAKSDLPELDEHELFMLRYFYSTEILTGDIMEFASTEFEKEFGEIDVMNVAIFTLHGIISAADSDDEAVKEAVKNKLSGMVDDKYHLNEWLYTIAAEITAYDETIFKCVKSGDVSDINAKLDKAVKEANYKAWKNELKVIERKASAKDRIDAITGGD